MRQQDVLLSWDCSDLATKKTLTIERYDTKLFAVGAIFGRLGKESTHAELGSVVCTTKSLEISGK